MKRTRSPVLILAIVAPLLAAGAASGATLAGKITYQGRAPSLKPLDMSSDANCAAKHSSPPKVETIVLGQNNALANVFVSVKGGLPNKQWPAPSEPAVLDQVGCLYVPHVVGVMAGQALKVKNSDGTLHNVHTFSTANPPVNLAMPPIITESNVPLQKPEEMFQVKCDVHSWMSAYIVVMPHPFFDTTGMDGGFTIEGLPAGTYEIEARHEFNRFPPQTLTVTLGADENKTLDFTFQGPSG